MNSTSPPPYNPDYIEYDIKPSAPSAPPLQRKNNIFCILIGESASGKTTYIRNEILLQNYDVIEVCYLNYMLDEYNVFASMITNKLTKREWFRKELKCCLILEDCYIRQNFREIFNILNDYKNFVDIYIATQQMKDIPLIIQKLSNKTLHMTINW